ncbi:site-specific DNA-methyltransferase [Croceicoccus gelatinilyticus]|uniref:site-specific DNA-methyltransferase n=1 Tax=Croceicoccus gelatinilyticus TaxID=2835536 RepID=UPI001BCB0AC2|nr:site-specific DNA-methyltransferase [Croceicoccus gelatinilyticus]MBS7671489.1 site-specific DNA-methyltransferase [Croceicoccus gelatinilyticus]
MTIEKLDASTPDLTRQNIERLLELFPECRTEGSREDAPSVDFDLLRQALSDYLVEGPAERYRLDWPGKRQALLTANTPIDKTLRPMREESVDFDTTRNLFIEGDNLDALKLLQETYLGKVKMIYIDPPYNTGNDFVYKDSFTQSRDDYEELSGQRNNSSGRLVANPESNGRFHSDWLSMMYPRLKLAKNLLREDGMIFISIDDFELKNLKTVCDEIFGDANFTECFVWKKSYGGGPKEKYAVTQHEYILLYAKNIERLPTFSLPYDPAKVERYYKGRDEKFEVRGPFRLKPLEATKSMDDRPNLSYDVELDNGEIISPKRQWIWSKERLTTGLENNDVIVAGKQGQKTLNYKQYLRDENGVERGEKPFSVIDGIYTQHGTEDLSSCFDGKVLLQFPKPIELLETFISLALDPRDRPLVMDFFAGSGTTAHAAFSLASKRPTNLSWIAVQLPEEVDEDHVARGYGIKNVAEISRERIRRAGAKILSDHADLVGKLDTGFRTLRIDSGNFVDTSVTPKEATQEALLGMVSHIKDDRSEEDLLFGSLLRWGVDITLPIEQRDLAGRTVWLVDAPEDGSGRGAALIACFAKPNSSGKGGIDTELADAMAALAPLRVLFRDDGFADDATKENVHSRFKQLAPDTQVRVL